MVFGAPQLVEFCRQLHPRLELPYRGAAKHVGYKRRIVAQKGPKPLRSVRVGLTGMIRVDALPREGVENRHG